MTADELTQREVNQVWNRDAPDGKCWACTKCKFKSTLGGNAGYHALKTGHGPPKLAKLPADQLMLTTPSTTPPLAVRAGDVMQVNYDLRMALEIAETAIEHAEAAGASQPVIAKLREMVRQLRG